MLKFLCPLFMFVCIFSCGKKEKSTTVEQLPPEQIETEKEELLKKQELLCEPGTYCPDYVAKIVVFDRGQVRYCTGTLVGKNKLLTSASCLPSYLRSTEADCSNDVYFFFGKGNRPPERMGCKSILQVSALDGNLAEYWRDDVAILELEKNLNWREFKDVSRRGLDDSDKIRFFAVEQSNEFTGVIRKEECEVVLGSYLYPLSSEKSSPNILAAGCSKKTGYRGAAILDNFPRIRGVLSDDSSLRASLENSSLLIKPLKAFVHISNFACAPFLDETSALNEQECAKELNYSNIAKLRDHLLSDQERYGVLVDNLEATANSASKYYRISAILNTVNDRQVVSFKPDCFKNVNSWINGVKADGEVNETPQFPAHTLRKGVDSYGRAVTQEVEEKKEKYSMTFSGKRLFKEKLSDIFLSAGNLPSRRISGIKACPAAIE
ncbi:MAG: hypothetical protein V4598_11255 [Bdellovibrionota bacterium]